tara:strand:+ start:3517 stop:4374 length:858 start_codon:yes stop_codon:yes gene_type:complete
MVKTVTDTWQEISVVNNLKWEFKLLGSKQDIPVLVAQDYWKFPDSIKDFFDNGYWYDNFSTNNIRPGKSFHIQSEVLEWFTTPIKKSLAPLFGLTDFITDCTFGNCFNTNMKLTQIQSAFPHVDIDNNVPLIHDVHIAANINITKSEHPVQTGFWSFNQLKSTLDFSHNDKAVFRDFYFKMGSNALTDNASWFQIEDYGPWVLEDIVTMCYNTIVVYPSHFFHNPIMKDSWFDDSDRVTISSFLNTSPSNLDFHQKDIDNISYAWEFFHLDKIHDYHPQKTIVPV